MKQPGTSDVGRQPDLGRNPSGGWRPVELPRNVPNPQRGTYSPDNPHVGSRAVFGVVLVAVLISLAANFTGPAIRGINRLLEPTAVYDTRDAYQTLEESEVAAGKEACSSRGHFSIAGTELVQPVRNLLQDAGYQIVGQDTSSYNEAHENGTTWYATVTTIQVTRDGEDGYQYVQLDSDTGTGALHEVSISLDNPERLTAATYSVLKILAEVGELSADAECFTLVPEGLPGALAGGSGYALLDGPILIEGIAYDQSYSVFISHNLVSDL